MTTPFTTILPLPNDAEGVDQLPLPEPFYYLVGRDGTYIYKNTLFGRVIVPVKEIGHLPKTGGYLTADITKLPAELVGQVLSFFQAIYAKRKSEAMVYLTFRDGTYRVFVPPQTATGGNVKATLDLNNIQDGWAIVGTIHSHCNFSAFHSGTDTHDADGHDGLHITVGHVNTDKPSYAAMLSFNKVRWDLELDRVVEGAVVPVPHPEWWERFVSEPVVRAITTGAGSYTGTGHYVGGGYAYGGHGSPPGTQGKYRRVIVSDPSLEGLLDSAMRRAIWSVDDYFEDSDAAMEYIAAVAGDLELVLGDVEAMGIDVDIRFRILEDPTGAPPARINAENSARTDVSEAMSRLWAD